MEKVVSRLNIFTQIWSKIAAAKSFFTDFFHLFTPFKRLFAPTSQSPMFKNFKLSESLGKSIGKKGSQIIKLLLILGVKLARIFYLIFCKFCLTSTVFLVSVLLSALVKRFLVSHMQDF